MGEPSQVLFTAHRAVATEENPAGTLMLDRKRTADYTDDANVKAGKIRSPGLLNE